MRCSSCMACMACRFGSKCADPKSGALFACSEDAGRALGKCVLDCCVSRSAKARGLGEPMKWSMDSA
jgi:hypothetical protein